MNAASLASNTPTGVGRLSARERRLLAGGAPLAALLLALLLRPDETETGVELSTPPAGSVGAVQATSASFDLRQADASAQVAAPTPIASPNMVLTGVFGGGPRGGAAIIQIDGAAQRVVPIGREVAAGLKVSGLGVSHAILTSEAGEVRLELGKPSGGTAGLTAAAPAGAPIAAAGTASSANRAGDGQREALQYRLGLEPRRSNGRIGGFAIKEGAAVPALQQAGLRPGDILVAVNGQAFQSEEKVLELSQEIAGSYVAEFEFLRKGKRMKALLPVNKRD
jgi:general secretion pathway protein C